MKAGESMCTDEMKQGEFLQVWKIMEESFPEDEHRPFEQQKKLLAKSEYKIYVQRVQGLVQGFVAVWELESLVFIEHLAVEKNFRNKGAGSELLSFVSRKYSCDICLEVEIPEDEITCRRVEFYKRNGFCLNNYPYTQPPLSEGQQAVPLLIMTKGKELTESEFMNMKSTLYKEVYNCHNLY